MAQASFGFDVIDVRRSTPERVKGSVQDSNSSFDDTDGPSIVGKIAIGMIAIGMAGLASPMERRGATADAFAFQSDSGTMPLLRFMNVQFRRSYAI
ncbi:MAG: hypothetical protein WA418_40295 [Bradyrhizobium sp.]